MAKVTVTVQGVPVVLGVASLFLGGQLQGASAYQIAIAAGFVGTEAQWLASLKGLPGEDSTVPGPSAYDVAVAGGFVGTEAQWLASLKGLPGEDSTVPGPSAYDVAVAGGFVGTEAQWLASLHGTPGAPGTVGDEYGAMIAVSSGELALGGYPCAQSLRGAGTLQRIYAKVMAGTGSATAQLYHNDVAVGSPITVTNAAAVTAGINEVLALGDSLAFNLISSSGITALWLQTDGGTP